MKKMLIAVLGVILICGFSTRLTAGDTPADPKFNSVEWYKCEVGRVKYKQGFEEIESKLQCLKNDKAITGNVEMRLVPVVTGKSAPVYYYPVMSKDTYQYFMDKDYSFQCAPSKDSSNTGVASYGISKGEFDIYMISPPEMSQYEGRNWVDKEYGQKGLVVNQGAAVGAFSYKGCGESLCQFYSKETNMRFGLFKIDCGSKGSLNIGGGESNTESKTKKLKKLFGR